MRVTTLITIISVAVSVARGSTVATAQGEVDFTRDVAPIFTRHCTSCHNDDDEKGELVLETYPDVIRGGEGGDVITPERSAESRLLRLIKTDDKTRMPPGKRRRLTAAEIAIIERWVDEGAKPPSSIAPRPRAVTIPRIEPLVRKPSPVTSIAYAPDGHRLAVARHGKVELLDVNDRRVVQELPCDRHQVAVVRFTPDGSRLVAAGGQPGIGGEIWVWDTSTLERLARLDGHADSIHGLAVAPDGELIATGSYDHEIRLWSLSKRVELRTLGGHNGAVHGLDFRRDGKILASASADRTAKLWDVTSGARLETFGQPLKRQDTIAFAPDGASVMAAGGDHRIRSWEVSATATEGSNPLRHARFAHHGRIVALAFSPTGRLIASGSADRTVKIWDAGTLREKLLLEIQPDWPSSLAFSPDGKTLAVGRLDGSVELYGTESGKRREVAARHRRGDGSTAIGIAAIAPISSLLSTIIGGVEGEELPATPEISAASPRGVTRGMTSRLRLSGKHLDKLRDARVDAKGITVSLLDDGRVDAASAWIEITPAADTPRAAYELSVSGENGQSKSLRLWIDDIPQHLETEPNDPTSRTSRNPDSARELPELPFAVWGCVERKGDLDAHAFLGRRDQVIVVDIEATRMGSELDASIALLDEDGRVLATSNDFNGNRDSFLARSLPRDGRYEIRVRDRQLGASERHFYRLSVGEFAFVTAHHPLSVAANAETSVELTGHNIAQDERVTVKAGDAGKIVLPLDPERLRWRRKPEVEVSEVEMVLESEPNDSVDDADLLPVPGSVCGRLGSEGDSDHFRFRTRRGQRLVLETEAAGRGSPADTRIEILHVNGRPVERVLLQATRDSSITFRPIDSNTRDARVVNWEEMELNDLLYMESEVVRLFRAPQGPDSGFQFYPAANGQRRTFFDTTPTHHAIEAACYVVVPHPPGTSIVPNGLPVFTRHFENDDDALRVRGRDSRVVFDAPSDGDYLVRVTDSGSAGGDRFVYRLVARVAAPDFRVELHGRNPEIPAGSGKGFSVSVERVDDFDGDVRIDVSGVPPGFRVTTPLVVQAGHREARGTIWAAPDAPATPEEGWTSTRCVATATIDGKEVRRELANLGTIRLDGPSKLRVFLEPWPGRRSTTAPGASPPTEFTVAPGRTVPALLRVERSGYEDLVTFSIDNLPHGVIVDNIGLNGVLLPAGRNERQVFIRCARWVLETSRACHGVANQEGRQTTAPAVLHVRRKDVAGPSR